MGRRAFLISDLALTAFPARAAPRTPVVTLLGDSITAGLGLPAAQALPAQLQMALGRIGVHAVVRGAGVSGDTTAGGLARVDFSVQGDTDVCVVALGGNDLLQGLDPKAARANLARIAARLKSRRITVLLAGLRAPPQIGRRYATEFDAAFAAVARDQHVALYRDLRSGMAGDRRLTQADGIHPNAAGVAVIARNLAPVVARALKASVRKSAR